MNHGCSSKYNVGPVQDVNEQNADENYLEEQMHFEWENVADSPVIARNARVLMHSLGYANRNIPTGSEIQENALSYASTLEQWKNSVLDLRAQCTTDGEVYVAEG